MCNRCDRGALPSSLSLILVVRLFAASARGLTLLRFTIHKTVARPTTVIFTMIETPRAPLITPHPLSVCRSHTRARARALCTVSHLILFY